MDKINFSIIGPATQNTHDLENEIKKVGHCVDVFPLGKIAFVFSDGNCMAIYNEMDVLKKYDIFIFRAYNVNQVFAQILAEKIIERKKIIIDEALGRKFIPSKVFEASKFEENNIHHPKTYQAITFGAWNKLIKKVKFPIIVKPIYGQKGQDMQQFSSEEECLQFFSKFPKGYLAQEKINIASDIRAFVVGNNVLGAMRRYIPKNDFRSNVSRGAKAEKIPLTETIKAIALSATKALGYEIAGVDIIESDGSLYVLEVNSAPQWQKFKEVTKINPAESIIDYALKKYYRKNNL